MMDQLLKQYSGFALNLATRIAQRCRGGRGASEIQALGSVGRDLPQEPAFLHPGTPTPRGLGEQQNKELLPKSPTALSPDSSREQPSEVSSLLMATSHVNPLRENPAMPGFQFEPAPRKDVSSGQVTAVRGVRTVSDSGLPDN